MNQANQPNNWLVCPQVRPEAVSRIFLFPYAGGAPSAFNKWSPEFPSTIETHIVHYPGRGSRHNEALLNSLDSLVEKLTHAIQPLLDIRFSFFGHSLGGTVAFELARHLRHNGLPQPSALFISACAAPQVPKSHPPIHTFPDDEFLNSLKELGGIPNEISQNNELLDILLPVLRADFELIETYQHVPGEPLECPILAFGGFDDPRVSLEQLEGWAMHTNAGFEAKYFAGDHFFINAARQSIIDEIASIAMLSRNDG